MEAPGILPFESLLFRWRDSGKCLTLEISNDRVSERICKRCKRIDFDFLKLGGDAHRVEDRVGGGVDTQAIGVHDQIVVGCVAPVDMIVRLHVCSATRIRFLDLAERFFTRG